MPTGRLIVLTGPSASGKTALATELLGFGAPYARLVTCTTRPPRPGETDGLDYHFLSRENFEAGTKRGDFFEWANVYGDYYGSRKSDVEKMIRDGKHAVVVMDAQGASTIRNAMPNAIILFIKTPLADLRSRMMQRAGFDKTQLETRLKELERESQLSGMADAVIENKNGHLAEAVLAMREFLSTKR